MATPIIDHNLLTLDYWQDSVTYEGKTVPGGTIGCEALNIRRGTLSEPPDG